MESAQNPWEYLSDICSSSLVKVKVTSRTPTGLIAAHICTPQRPELFVESSQMFEAGNKSRAVPAPQRVRVDASLRFIFPSILLSVKPHSSPSFVFPSKQAVGEARSGGRGDLAG